MGVRLYSADLKDHHSHIPVSLLYIQLDARSSNLPLPQHQRANRPISVGVSVFIWSQEPHISQSKQANREEGTGQRLK